jgi:hypothetical protein
MINNKKKYDNIVNNLLTKNIFIEQQHSTTIPNSPAENDPNWVAAKNTWEKYTGKQFYSLSETQRNSVSRNFLKPAAQTGYLVDPRNGKKIPIK